MVFIADMGVATLEKILKSSCAAKVEKKIFGGFNMIKLTAMGNEAHLEKWFVKSVHEASLNELYEAKVTYLNGKSTSEYWALNVINREIASREV